MEVRFDDRLSGHRYGFRGQGEVVAAHHIGEVIPAFEYVESEVAGGRWAAGFVSYEAAPAFDDVLVVRSDGRGPSAIPLLWFALYDDRVDPGPVPQGQYELSAWEAVEKRDQYMRSLARIQSHIEAGDTYQVNYTYQQSARWRGDTRGFYADLLTAQSAAYGAYLDTGRFQILSASPELFFVRDDDHIVCRPMKGTSARGRWPTEDRALLSALLSSEKERAENVMIVDLIRNDLGRVARFGTVEVDELIAAEQYETVWQLVSSVSAELLPATSTIDLFRALFPCGSVTGAPKVRTMEIIADVEAAPRGVYCGTIGMLSPPGSGAPAPPSVLPSERSPLTSTRERRSTGSAAESPMTHYLIRNTRRLARRRGFWCARRWSSNSSKPCGGNPGAGSHSSSNTLTGCKIRPNTADSLLTAPGSNGNSR